MNKIEEVILRFVTKEIGADELTEEHKKYVLNLYRSMSPETFRGHKLSQVAPVLGKVLGAKLQIKMATELNDEPIDLHEYQKVALGAATREMVIAERSDGDNMASTSEQSLSIDNFLGIDDLTELKMLFNPESLYRHYYLVLDSDYRDTTQEVSTTIKKFTWKYAPTQSTGVGFCNSVGVIKNVIGMRMYQPRVPYLATMNTSAKRVSVLIEEFSSQSFIGENGRRFHFLLRPNFITGQTSIELSTEDYNDGIFNFRKPITNLDTMTLSFGDPLNVLEFSTPFDRFIIPFEFTCI